MFSKLNNSVSTSSQPSVFIQYVLIIPVLLFKLPPIMAVWKGKWMVTSLILGFELSKYQGTNAIMFTDVPSYNMLQKCKEYEADFKA